MLRVALLDPPVTTVLEEEYDRPDFPGRSWRLSPSWRDYNKPVGGAVEMQDLTRRQMEFLQFIGYNWVFIRNGRLLDWLGFMRHYRRAGFALVRTLLRPRARRVERRDAAHVFFDDVLEVKKPESEQERLGG